ncbi:FAD-dependent oxidoreductase [Microbacterium terrisoli]|jgi:NADPH-dependent 2,4-dienoyl-CoA reductase/sulfur reductase-like enzyme|uniref:FAD-dependent oxidoreductase n=1 Tax=Microbacterium terrisoli TaxID=3242192 RepID=UPI0028064738|nr:FAD-dependent oxidoreductase [Microbacterium protaetiae]
MTTVAILGAGPAGLAAAQSALAAGADVVVVDEAERIGGQFWRHHDTLTDRRMQHQWARFERLRALLDPAGTAASAGRVVVHSSASVWRIETGAGIRVHALVGPADAAARQGLTIQADALVIATGAHDRALPVPGWTLPGVVTAGAAQAIAKRDGVAIGRRTVVAGAGPFLLPVASSLALAGGSVVEVVEATRAAALVAGWARAPWRLAGSAPAKAPELWDYVSGLVRRRTPYRTGSAVTRIHGRGRVEAATIQRIDGDWRPIVGTERLVECDAVALGHGFTPRLEAAIQAGCDIRPDRFVAVDQQQATSVAGVYAAGEVTGIAGADAALAEGAVAGFAAAGGDPTDARIRPARLVRRRMHAFAERLKTHDIRPGWKAWLDDDTVICRCETVTRAQIAEYAGASSRGLRLATRAGLGACQGRTCGRTVEELTGVRIGYDARPVLGSVRVGELAAVHAERVDAG